MTDLDALEEIAGPLGEWKPPRASRVSGIARKGNLATHCKRGHALSGDNLYVSPKGVRLCKRCARLRLLCREDS